MQEIPENHEAARIDVPNERIEPNERAVGGAGRDGDTMGAE